MKIFVALMVWLLSLPVYADKPSELTREAERLLELSGSKAAMLQMTDMMLEQQLQQNPTLIPFEGVMRRFFEKHLSYENLKDEYIALYVEAFTVEELREMNRFFASDVGRKSVSMMPTLMQKGGELGASRVAQHLGELQAMIQEEAARLKQLQAPE